VALEMIEDQPRLDVVVVPMGGGGLISGIGVALAQMAPGCRLVGVAAAASEAFGTARRHGRITEIAQQGGHSATVNLDSGRNVAVDILFAHPRNKPSASLHESLGLATIDTPLGIVLKVDERRETSMPGIYAAGDLANPLMPSVTTASSHGAMAGIFAQQSMLV
jgi:thioredoxin reductase